jgi:hypothetical protein
LLFYFIVVEYIYVDNYQCMTDDEEEAERRLRIRQNQYHGQNYCTTISIYTLYTQFCCMLTELLLVN